MIGKLKEAVEFLQAQYATSPELGIVLGTGLGNFVNEIKVELEIPYSAIPNFPVSTVEGL